MWLRNWYSIWNALFLSRTTDAIPATNPTDDPPITFKDTTGAWRIMTGQGHNYSSSMGVENIVPGKTTANLGNDYQSNNSTQYTIIFGTGTTPVTVEDYRIETPITSGLVIAAQPTTLVNKTAYSNGRYSYKTRSAINNTSAANITISEIALNAPSNLVRTYPCCVYREVLSSPITLEPGDTVLVEYEWDAPIYQAPTP